MLYTLLRREPIVQERLLAILTFAFLTGLCAQAKVYLGNNPVPITLQVLAVLLTGLMLRPADAFAAMASYLGLIAAGLPLAAGGAAGMSVLTGATAGYLISYPFAAWAVSLVAGQRQDAVRSMAGSLLGIGIIYLLGASWLGMVLGSARQAWEFGVAPFIVVDLAKAILAVFAGEGAIRALLPLRR